MSARRYSSTSKKIRSRLTVIAAWLRTHQRLVGLWMFLVGFLLVTFPSVYRLVATGRLARPQSQFTQIASTTIRKTLEATPFRIDEKLLSDKVPTQPPLRIIVPSYKVDLSIVEAQVVNGYWELSETTASHGVGSANPGEIGNTVIFAHARDELFGPIRYIKKDEDIYILTKDRWFRYRVAETKLVDPSQIEHIKSSDAEELTLFTCSGFLDTKRLIVHAKPLRP